MLKKITKYIKAIDARVLLPLLILVTFGYGVIQHVNYRRMASEALIQPIKAVNNDSGSPTIYYEDCDVEPYKFDNKFVVADGAYIPSPQMKNLMDILDHENGYNEFETNEDFNIINTSYNAETGIVALLTSNRYSYTAEDFFSKVYLFNTHDNSFTLILEIPESTNGEFLNSGQDIEFSNDGSLLAIGAAESIYLYSLDTKKLEQIYYKERTGDSPKNNLIFGYGFGSFNHDNSKLLVYVGYYESGNDAILDLQTGELRNLPYSIYGLGEKVLGWFGDDLLLWTRKAENINSLDIVDSKTLYTKKNILSTDYDIGFGFNKGIYYLDNQIILRTWERKKNTNIFACNNVNQKYEVTRSYDKIYKLDLNGNLESLLTTDSTSSSGLPQGTSIESIEQYDTDEVLVEIKDKYGSKNYILNIIVPEKLRLIHE